MQGAGPTRRACVRLPEFTSLGIQFSSTGAVCLWARTALAQQCMPGMVLLRLHATRDGLERGCYGQEGTCQDARNSSRPSHQQYRSWPADTDLHGHSLIAPSPLCQIQAASKCRKAQAVVMPQSLRPLTSTPAYTGPMCRPMRSSIWPKESGYWTCAGGGAQEQRNG